MNHLLHKWRNQIAETCSVLLGTKVRMGDIQTPPDSAFGDVALSCFRLAKERRVLPNEFAKFLAKKFPIQDNVERVKAFGPYVNFFFSAKTVMRDVVSCIHEKGDHFGDVELGNGGKIVFEYANPNTHKEIHVGHLRNFLLGASLVRILQKAGWHMTPVSYINDVGSNVVKCLWWLVREGGADPMRLDGKIVQSLLAKIPIEQRNGNFLGSLYSRAVQQIEMQPEAVREISFIQQQLEAHDLAYQRLWSETRAWCLEELRQIFEETGVRLERQYFESDLLDRSREIVEELLRKDIARESEGAVIVDLEMQQLGVWLLRKSDGNLLYSSKDIALAEQKLRNFPEMEWGITLVDIRQRLYFKQLAATLALMGVTVPFKFLGYEIVTLPEGIMSSRKGTIVTYAFLRQAVFEQASCEARERHPEWSPAKISETARSIGHAGMVFGMLRQASERVLVFDVKKISSFDGATGPYCQYAVMRLRSILRRAQNDSGMFSVWEKRTEVHDSEKRLAISLARFSERIEQAAIECSPSILADWCIETAKRVNDFYRDVPVLDALAAERSSRLELCRAASQVLGQGLTLLGIPTLEEM